METIPLDKLLVALRMAERYAETARIGEIYDPLRAWFAAEAAAPPLAQWTLPCAAFVAETHVGQSLKQARDTAQHHLAASLVDTDLVARLAQKIRTASVAVVTALLGRAHKRFTLFPPVMHVEDVPTALSRKQEDALDVIARWQLCMIWYGVGSPKERATCFALCQWFSLEHLCVDNLLVAMCFNLAVADHQRGGGDAVMFAPAERRTFCTNQSPLLDDAFSVYCLLETSCDGSVYPLADSYLRADLDFNLKLIFMAGDDVICLIDVDLYDDSPLLSTWVLQARNVHYQYSPERKRWLRASSTQPLLKWKPWATGDDDDERDSD